MRCSGGRKTLPLALALTCILLIGYGCGPQVIPKELEGQVDRKVSFLQLKESPATYTGRTVVLGGQVLSAKRGNDMTRMEVPKIPLNSCLEPGQNRMPWLGDFWRSKKSFW